MVFDLLFKNLFNVALWMCVGVSFMRPNMHQAKNGRVCARKEDDKQKAPVRE